MPLLDTNQWGVVPDAEPAAKTKPKAGFIDGLAATWQQESIWVSSKVRPSLEYPDDTSFDYKSYPKEEWAYVARARNKEHADDILSQVKREKENKEIMDQQGFVLGMAQNMAVGLTNPLNYIGLGGAKTILGAAGKGALGAMAGTAATEPILHMNQETRTWQDSAGNIAAAAVLGAPLGAAGKVIGNKLDTGRWLDSDSKALERQLLQEGVIGGKPFGSNDDVGAARATIRSKLDSKVARVPEWMTRWALLGDLTRSANQRLSTSSFQSSRNAVNRLARQNLATAENLRGVANEVPVEIAAGQHNAQLTTQLLVTNEHLENAWLTKVKNGTYESKAIIEELKRLDPSLPDDYQITSMTYRKLMKHYMASTDDITLQMPEVELGAKAIADARNGIEADSINYGRISKDKLIDIATGERIVKPENSPDAAALAKLRAERAAFVEELDAAKANKLPKADKDAIRQRIKDHDDAIEQRKAALQKRKEEYDAIQPDAQKHKVAYDDGDYYLSRVPDKGKIMNNKLEWKEALVRGWVERNGWTPKDLEGELRVQLMEAAEAVTNKLLGDQQTVSLGELHKGSNDLPANIFKERTLALDDKHIARFMHDDVIATELYYYSQATVDLELAKSNTKLDDLIRGVQDELNSRVEDITQKISDPNKRASMIQDLQVEARKDIEQINYIISRLKRKGGGHENFVSDSFADWVNRANKVAGMAQLGGSAVPTSIPDIAAVGRSLGHARTTWNIVRGIFDKEFRKDMMENAKEMGVLSELINQQIRDMHINEMANQSLDPNKGFKSIGLQRVDTKLDQTADIFGKVSLINFWAKSGRVIASTSATQNIIKAAEKGWKNLDSTSQMDLAKFYLDEDMLSRIATQIGKHADNVEGVKFAGVDKWDDAEAARIFRSSVYAATEAALNLPSAGSGSKWQNDTLAGRVFMRFKSFNNAAHESTFLQSLQNREVSRVVTGTLAYAFWGFASLVAYDMVRLRYKGMDEYFGDAEKMQKTAWKVLAKTGYMASAQDAFVNASKLAGAELSPVKEKWRSVFPKGLEDELFPKYDDLDPLEKTAGPTYGWLSKGFTGLTGAAGSLLHGEAPKSKDIASIRQAIPFNNTPMFGISIGFDYVEEMLGGRKMDRYQTQ